MVEYGNDTPYPAFQKLSSESQVDFYALVENRFKPDLTEFSYRITGNRNISEAVSERTLFSLRSDLEAGKILLPGPAIFASAYATLNELSSVEKFDYALTSDDILEILNEKSLKTPEAEFETEAVEAVLGFVSEKQPFSNRSRKYNALVLRFVERFSMKSAAQIMAEDLNNFKRLQNLGTEAIRKAYTDAL